MLKKLSRLLAGFICGYLITRWIPVSQPFHPSDLVVEFVMNPFEFIAAGLAFLTATIANADLFKDAVTNSWHLFLRKPVSLLETFISLCVLASFYILFQLGFWQTAILFSFSLIYGIISIDFKNKNGENIY